MPSPDEQAAATVPLNPQSPWAQLLSDSGEPYYYNETSHETPPASPSALPSRVDASVFAMRSSPRGHASALAFAAIETLIAAALDT